MKHLMPWLFVASLTACGETALLDVHDGSGPTPQLPAPTKTILPTVNIAPAVGWPNDVKPQAAPGTQVKAFASGLEHPAGFIYCPTAMYWWPKPTRRPNPKTAKACVAG